MNTPATPPAAGTELVPTVFSVLRYAQVWEDADVLLAAFDPRPGQTFLSVGSAGDNALALLACDPARGWSPWGEALRFPFTLAFAAHAGMIALAHLRDGNRRPAGGRVVTEATAVAGALVLVPYVVLDARGGPAVWGQLGIGLVVVAMATGIFARWQERMEDCPIDGSRWLRQGTLGVVSSLVGLSVSFA